MRLRLTGDKVLVRLDPMDETWDCGDGVVLHRSEQAKDYPTTGTVVAAGPGEQTKRGLRRTTVRKGDRVILTIRPGQDLWIDGVAHTVTREFRDDRTGPPEGILAVIG